MIGKNGGAPVFLGFVLIVAVFGVWLVNYNNQECQSNAACGEGSYCSVNHECNVIPVIKEVEIVEKSNAGAAAILALGLIGFAIIMRHEKMMEYVKKWKADRGNVQEIQDEPYYQSVSSYETKLE